MTNFYFRIIGNKTESWDGSPWDYIINYSISAICCFLCSLTEKSKGARIIYRLVGVMQLIMLSELLFVMGYIANNLITISAITIMLTISLDDFYTC